MSKDYDNIVVTPSRLHLGLHDCGYATRRQFGGSGIFINGFDTTVSSRLADSPRVSFSGIFEPSERARQATESLVERIARDLGSVSVEVSTLAPEHKGFGSKTSLLLAIAQSAFLAHGIGFGKNTERIVKLTERGGTSGIGINGFWKGGYIIDDGHQADMSNRNFAPSSGRRPSSLPRVIAASKMPENWKVGLYYDANSQTIEGEEEKALFTSIMPIPDKEIHKAMAATFHGVLPAILNVDIELLAVSLHDLNTTGMKRKEIELQTDTTQEFLNRLWSNNLAAGMTSFGPTTFCIFDDTDSLLLSDTIAASTGMTNMGVHEFNNIGAVTL